MSDPIDLNQPSKQIVLDLLNRDNNRSLTLSDVDFDNFVALAPEYSRNTKARVVALTNSGYSGEREIYYNRLDLATFFSNTTPAILSNDPVSTHNALSLINSTYNLQLSEIDIIGESIFGDSWVFKASPDSPVWIGQVTVIITPRTDDNYIDLFDDIAVETLGGFTGPTFDVNIDYDIEEENLGGFGYP